VLPFRITATFDNYPSKKATQNLKITLNNLCAASRFTSPSSQALIVYQDGSNVATSVTAFTFTSDQTAANCAFTHTILFRNSVNDAWSSTVPAYVDNLDSATLSFDIKTLSADIATPGDVIASRWVKRVHTNPFSGQSIEQEFQI
jgi:hypothetical protein